MIRFLFALLVACSLVACADQPQANKGAAALLYPELNSFSIDIKTNGVAASQKQMAAIINDFLPAAPDSQWHIRYRTPQGYKIALQAAALLRQANINPAQVTLTKRAKLGADVMIDIKQYQLITAKCDAYSISNENSASGCFIDSLIMQQIASPSRLLTVDKE